MKRKLCCKSVVVLLIFLNLLFFSSQSVSAKENYTVNYQTKNEWNSGYEGELQITNDGTSSIEYWIIEFDLAEEITGIWGGKILSHINNHYVITYDNFNSVIEAGKEIENFTSSKYENVTFNTNDGLSLKGIFFPIENSKGTLVVLHGRGTNMYWTIQNIQFLVDNGYQVLLYNARFWNYYKNPEESYLFINKK